MPMYGQTLRHHARRSIPRRAPSSRRYPTLISQSFTEPTALLSTAGMYLNRGRTSRRVPRRDRGRLFESIGSEWALRVQLSALGVQAGVVTEPSAWSILSFRSFSLNGLIMYPVTPAFLAASMFSGFDSAVTRMKGTCAD